MRIQCQRGNLIKRYAHQMLKDQQKFQHIKDQQTKDQHKKDEHTNVKCKTMEISL